MPESNVALLKRWFEEVWNQRRRETVGELFAADGISHGVDEIGGVIRGPNDFLSFYDRFCGAFPDLKLRVEECFGSGDLAVLRWTARMTHTGDHLGIPASKKEIAIGGMTMAKIANGQIVEAWDNWDKLALLQQVGVVPLAASANSAG
jgi:steroid delta-isomerase-like uncharacterized protein